MKKNIFIPLLFLTVMITACSNDAKKESTANTDTVVETTTVAPTTTEAPTTQETTTEAAVIKEDDIQYYRGRKENNVYTNTVFNIKFDATANGYKMQSRDNIAQMRDIFIKQSGMSQEEADSSIYMDVYATSENGKGVSRSQQCKCCY